MTKQALVNQQYNLVIPITMYSTSVSESHQNNKMIRTILFIHRNDSAEFATNVRQYDATKYHIQIVIAISWLQFIEKQIGKLL